MPVPSVAVTLADMSEHPIVACYRGLDSADAVGLGALLAGVLDEPLVLAGAYRYEPTSLSARTPEDPDNARRAEAVQASLRRARQFAGRDVEVREDVVPATDIAGSLLGLASDVDACLLVLGRDVHGRITRSLVPRALCPVVVAPLSVPLPRVGPPRRIGLAFDGSPTAQWALVVATALAQRTGARLVLLAVGRTREYAATWLQVAQLSLGTRIEHETCALTGDPAPALVAATEDLDLLVCGSRGRGRALSAFLGSVSTQLVEQAHCPVLVVPSRVWRADDTPLGVTTAGTIGRPEGTSAHCAG